MTPFCVQARSLAGTAQGDFFIDGFLAVGLTFRENLMSMTFEVKTPGPLPLTGDVGQSRWLIRLSEKKNPWVLEMD